MLHRLLTGVYASVAALLIWVIAVPVFDADLGFTDVNNQPQTVDPVAIIIFSVGSALAGWALLAALERFAPKRAKLIWTIVASLVLALSMVPLLGVSAGAAVTLGLMHLAVGAVIIVVMRRTSAQPALAAQAA